MAAPTLKDVFEEVTTLSARVVTLEALAASNKERLDALEANKGERSEIEAVRSELERERWAQRYRRRR